MKRIMSFFAYLVLNVVFYPRRRKVIKILRKEFGNKISLSPSRERKFILFHVIGNQENSHGLIRIEDKTIVIHPAMKLTIYMDEKETPENMILISKGPEVDRRYGFFNKTKEKITITPGYLDFKVFRLGSFLMKVSNDKYGWVRLDAQGSQIDSFNHDEDGRIDKNTFAHSFRGCDNYKTQLLVWRGVFS